MKKPQLRNMSILETLAEIESTVKNIRTGNYKCKGVLIETPNYIAVVFKYRSETLVTYKFTKTDFIKNTLNNLWQ